MNKRAVKFLLKKLLKFIFVFLFIDFAIGSLAQHIYFSQKTGKYARISYSIYKTTAEILIFGSSHANRQYVPSIFEEELKQTCYNVGVQGQKIIFHSALQEIILERTTPKLILLNIDENWLFKSEEAYDRLGDFYPYYWDMRDILKPIIGLKTKFTDSKLLFKSYQTNSTLIHTIFYFLFPQIDLKGYRPLFDKMKLPNDFECDNEIISEKVVNAIDENFINAFNKFITNAKKKNIKLLLILSPSLYGKDLSNNVSMNKMREIANNENISIIDLSNETQFIKNYSLFHDASHLNDEGAHLYTKLLIEYINTLDNKL